MANLNTKYEVPDTVGSHKLKRWSRKSCNPDRTKFEGIFIICWLKLAMVSSCTKFEMPRFTLFTDREGPKIKKKIIIMIQNVIQK